MITIYGKILKIYEKDIFNKNKTKIRIKVVLFQPKNSFYPIKVNIGDFDKDIGKPGDLINLEVMIYPFYFKEGKRVKAQINYFVPLK